MEYITASIRRTFRRLSTVGQPSVSSALSQLGRTATVLRKAQDAAITKQDAHEAQADHYRALVRGEVAASSCCEADALKAGRVAQRIEDLMA